jgi:FkbM family methyltransferase
MRSLSKPHYVFRPSQLVRRFQTRERVRTPWGEMRVAEDVLGRGIARIGVHELAVSETIWRLAESGDLAVDVGANVGYFTGLLAGRVREVIALEPNPLLLEIVSENVDRFGGSVTLLPWAASSWTGSAELHLPADFAQNNGIATLEDCEGDSYEVKTTRLEELTGDRPVGLLKIDVEGHELAVLEGARLELVRDIIFEEHRPLPSPVSAMLEGAGFEIRGIEETFLGPRLVQRTPRSWDAPTYLATRELPRAARLLAPRGWRCLRPSRG